VGAPGQSCILDRSQRVLYIGLMNLSSIGRMVAERRRAKGLTLRDVAGAARVGRSTLAALESGKLTELGLAKVERICAAVDVTLEARPLELAAPLMRHRHLTDEAGLKLTKAAMEDVILRGGVAEWRDLTRVIRADGTGRLARRAQDVASALGKHDQKARAFAVLLPVVLRPARYSKREHV